MIFFKRNMQNIICIVLIITITLFVIKLQKLNQRINHLEMQLNIESMPFSEKSMDTPFVTSKTTPLSRIQGEFYELKSDHNHSKDQINQRFLSLNGQIQNLKNDIEHNAAITSDLNTKQMIMCNELDMNSC